MARYIDADKIKKAIKDYGKGCISGGIKTLDVVDDVVYIAGLVDMVSTADVQEVKHGKWKKAMPRRKGRNATYRCSCCGQLRSSYYNDVQNWEYCPCGAKMDKE